MNFSNFSVFLIFLFPNHLYPFLQLNKYLTDGRNCRSCIISQLNAEKSLLQNLKLRRVDVPYLTESMGKQVFYYEVNDWRFWGDSDGETQNTEQSVYVVGSFTYGAKLWPACLAVSNLLLEDSHLIKERTLLDVGCGVGLVSTTAAFCGAKEIIAVDISDITLELVSKASAEMNITTISTQNFDILGRQRLPSADVVVFADVLYTQQLARGVARRVAEAKKEGRWIIVGSMRGREGREVFLQTLEELGISETFKPSEDDVVVALPQLGWKRKEVEILEINRPIRSN